MQFFVRIDIVGQNRTGAWKNIDFSIEFSSQIDQTSTKDRENIEFAPEIDKTTLPGTEFFRKTSMLGGFGSPIIAKSLRGIPAQEVLQAIQ